jgi:cell division transport system permease protein
VYSWYCFYWDIRAFIINSKKLADDFKEKIAMTVFFKNEANDILKAFGRIKICPYAKSTNYVTKNRQNNIPI